MTIMKFIRVTSGMTQAELAALIGVTQPKISAWETRREDVPLRRVEEIAGLFHVAPEKLLLDVKALF